LFGAGSPDVAERNDNHGRHEHLEARGGGKIKVMNVLREKLSCDQTHSKENGKFDRERIEQGEEISVGN